MIDHHPLTVRIHRTHVPADVRSATEAPRTILVADEDRDLCEIYQIVLRFNGYRVVAASDGVEAVKIVRDLQPDAAILDLNLPRLSGLEATRLLHQHPDTAGTPVILLSLYSDPRLHRRAIEAGCGGYMVKPFGSQDLLAEVRRVLTGEVALRVSA